MIIKQLFCRHNFEMLNSNFQNTEFADALKHFYPDVTKANLYSEIKEEKISGKTILVYDRPKVSQGGMDFFYKCTKCGKYKKIYQFL